MIKKVGEIYKQLGQYVGAAFHAPTKRQGELALYAIGIGLLGAGLSDLSLAQSSITVEDDRLIEIIEALLEYVEGSFGALIMVAAGIGAIVSAAFGQYKAALGLLVVAVGAFILRSLVNTFFELDL